MTTPPSRTSLTAWEGPSSSSPPPPCQGVTTGKPQQHRSVGGRSGVPRWTGLETKSGRWWGAGSGTHTPTVTSAKRTLSSLATLGMPEQLQPALSRGTCLEMRQGGRWGTGRDTQSVPATWSLRMSLSSANSGLVLQPGMHRGTGSERI